MPSNTLFAYNTASKPQDPHDPLVLRPDNPYETIPLSVAKTEYPTEYADPASGTLMADYGDHHKRWYRNGLLHDSPTGAAAVQEYVDEEQTIMHRHFYQGARIESDRAIDAPGRREVVTRYKGPRTMDEPSALVTWPDDRSPDLSWKLTHQRHPMNF